MSLAEISNIEADFFVKQTTQITIIPSFEEETLHFISGSFGPFKPNKGISVPLWLGIYLKQRSKCRIAYPDWLTPKALTLIVNKEKDEKEALTGLPFYYLEIAHILLKNASDDTTDMKEIKKLLEDLESVRDCKIQDLQNRIEKNDEFIQINNITFSEINKRRKILDNMLTQLSLIKSQDESQDLSSQRLVSQSQFSSQNY